LFLTLTLKPLETQTNANKRRRTHKHAEKRKQTRRDATCKQFKPQNKKATQNSLIRKKREINFFTIASTHICEVYYLVFLFSFFFRFLLSLFSLLIDKGHAPIRPPKGH
jgi:uncharacterized Rmd1/YagE family protein